MINLTSAAETHIRKALLKQGAIGIRFGVKQVGCSGYAYTTEYITEPISAVEQQFAGFSVFIKEEDRKYLTGLTVDFVRKGFQESFQFINPNEKARCGCGESFAV